MDMLVQLLILAGVIVIVLVVAMFLLNQFAVDPAIRKIVTVVLVIVVAIIAIWILLSFGGHKLVL